MNITILSVSINTKPTAKGSYQEADVAYKNNSFQGKVEGKKIMSFGAASKSFKILSEGTAVGKTFEVTVVKNDKGYNDWVDMKEASADTSSSPSKAPTSGANPAPRSNYETPEERAQRQVLIVRQSSLSAAVSTLSVGAKAVKASDVLALADEFANWVFQKKSPGATGFDDVPDFPEDFDPKVD